MHEHIAAEEISLADFKIFFTEKNQTVTEAQKALVFEILADLEKEEIPNAEMAQIILEGCYRREIGRRCAEASINVMHGKSEDIGSIEKVLLDYRQENVAADNDQPVNEDLDYLLEANKNNVQWKFNIASLAHHLPGIGAGIFTIVAGRVEMGKTALWTSWCAGPEGFAWQGAKINVFKNEEKGERDFLRLYSAATGMCYEELISKREIARDRYAEISGRIRVYNAAGWDFSRIDAILDRDNPDIIIIDMLDKVVIEDVFNATHEKLKEIYTQARHRAIVRNKAVIGFSQLSADAHNVLKTDMSMLENSKTGKAAEADVAICIGARDDMPNQRQLNLCKNKLTGSHEPVMVRIQPEISRYVE